MGFGVNHCASSEDSANVLLVFGAASFEGVEIANRIGRFGDSPTRALVLGANDFFNVADANALVPPNEVAGSHHSSVRVIHSV
jgi:hypothetical protein